MVFFLFLKPISRLIEKILPGQVDSLPSGLNFLMKKLLPIRSGPWNA